MLKETVKLSREARIRERNNILKEMVRAFLTEIEETGLPSRKDLRSLLGVSRIDALQQGRIEPSFQTIEKFKWDETIKTYAPQAWRDFGPFFESCLQGHSDFPIPEPVSVAREVRRAAVRIVEGGSVDKDKAAEILDVYPFFLNEAFIVYPRHLPSRFYMAAHWPSFFEQINPKGWREEGAPIRAYLGDGLPHPEETAALQETEGRNPGESFLGKGSLSAKAIGRAFTAIRKHANLTTGEMAARLRMSPASYNVFASGWWILSADGATWKRIYKILREEFPQAFAIYGRLLEAYDEKKLTPETWPPFAAAIPPGPTTKKTGRTKKNTLKEKPVTPVPASRPAFETKPPLAPSPPVAPNWPIRPKGPLEVKWQICAEIQEILRPYRDRPWVLAAALRLNLSLLDRITLYKHVEALPSSEFMKENGWPAALEKLNKRAWAMAQELHNYMGLTYREPAVKPPNKPAALPSSPAAAQEQIPAKALSETSAAALGSAANDETPSAPARPEQPAFVEREKEEEKSSTLPPATEEPAEEDPRRLALRRILQHHAGNEVFGYGTEALSKRWNLPEPFLQEVLLGRFPITQNGRRWKKLLICLERDCRQGLEEYGEILGFSSKAEVQAPLPEKAVESFSQAAVDATGWRRGVAAFVLEHHAEDPLGGTLEVHGAIDPDNMMLVKCAEPDLPLDVCRAALSEVCRQKGFLDGAGQAQKPEGKQALRLLQQYNTLVAAQG